MEKIARMFQQVLVPREHLMNIMHLFMIIMITRWSTHDHNDKLEVLKGDDAVVANYKDPLLGNHHGSFSERFFFFLMKYSVFVITKKISSLC